MLIESLPAWHPTCPNASRFRRGISAIVGLPVLLSKIQVLTASRQGNMTTGCRRVAPTNLAKSRNQISIGHYLGIQLTQRRKVSTSHHEHPRCGILRIQSSNHTPEKQRHSTLPSCTSISLWHPGGNGIQFNHSVSRVDSNSYLCLCLLFVRISASEAELHQ